MERRAFATWEKLYPEIEAIMTSPISEYDDDATNNTIPKEEMIHILVGETQRVYCYPQQGYILPQELPPTVWKAYEELVKRGFIAHLIKD